MENRQVQELYNLMLNNPQFRKFVKENENKTIEEISMKYHILTEGAVCTKTSI